MTGRSLLAIPLLAYAMTGCARADVCRSLDFGSYAIGQQVGPDACDGASECSFVDGQVTHSVTEGLIRENRIEVSAALPKTAALSGPLDDEGAARASRVLCVPMVPRLEERGARYLESEELTNEATSYPYRLVVYDTDDGQRFVAQTSYPEN